jgi:hypothetical protein
MQTMKLTEIEQSVMLWFFGLLVLCVCFGWFWGKFYSNGINNGEKSASSGFRSLLVSRVELTFALLLAFILSYLFCFLIANSLNQSIIKKSQEIPVSYSILKAMGYSDAEEARELLQEQVNKTQKEDMWLYEELVKELFGGNVPAEFTPLEGAGFDKLKGAIIKNTSGGNENSPVHSEFSTLFNSLGISGYILKNTNQCSYDGVELENNRGLPCIPREVLPLPKAAPVFQPEKPNPATYLRSKNLDEISASAGIWLEILMFSQNDNLKPEIIEYETILWKQYVTHYLAMFEEETRQQARMLGPIQFTLYLFFFFTLIVLTKRYGYTRTQVAKDFIIQMLKTEVSDGSKSGDEAIFKKAWHDFLDDLVYVPINYMIWAIPSVGFIGTVVGISESLGKAYLVVVANGKAEQALAVGKVTELLSLAFDTTLIALILNVIVMALMYFVRANETRLLYLPSTTNQSVVV